MTMDRATEILHSMASGIDPITGEILAANHFCNSPEVIRALYTAIQAMSGADHAGPSYLVRKNGKLNAGRPWTDADLDTLRCMYQEGKSMEWICAKLQRRKRGVLNQLKCLGLTESAMNPDKTPPGLERAGQRWTHEEDAQLKDLHSEKWPIAKIAAKMQRSDYAIYCRMEKLQLYGVEYGYPSKEEPSPWNNENKQLLREMYLSGTPIDELADHFNCTEKGIRARLFYMGLFKESPLSILRKNS